MQTIGIMTSDASHLNRFNRYLEPAESNGFSVLVFTPLGVNLKRKEIKGYVRRHGKWVTTICSFPALIYDVGYYRNKPILLKALDIKTRGRIPFVSDWPGNKWRIHSTLLSCTGLSEHLIETRPLVYDKDAVSMAEKYGVVLLKPINGDSGTGIQRLKRISNDRFLLEDGNAAKELGTGALLHTLKVLRKKGYIIQQWLDLRDAEGRVRDIRALIQKNKDGKWHFTGAVMRQGARGKFTSNLETGGKVIPAYANLVERYGEKAAQRLYAKLQKLSFKIANELENADQKRYAELGLDFAIDRNERIFFLEANDKPSKSMMKLHQEGGMFQKSIQLPFQYARFLTANGTIRERDTKSLAGKKLDVENIIRDGFHFLRTPYRFGANSWIDDTFDCSSFLQYIFARNGVSLPRTSRQQSRVGREIPREQIRRGDLLFFRLEKHKRRNRVRRIEHVGLYLGDNKLLHSNSDEGVSVNDLAERWGRLFETARRMVE